jgi:hypothetical protein
LSNPEAVEVVALAGQAFGGGTAVDSSTSAAPRATRPWRLVDRLGERIIRQLP